MGGSRAGDRALADCGPDVDKKISLCPRRALRTLRSVSKCKFNKIFVELTTLRDCTGPRHATSKVFAEERHARGLQAPRPENTGNRDGPKRNHSLHFAFYRSSHSLHRGRSTIHGRDCCAHRRDKSDPLHPERQKSFADFPGSRFTAGITVKISLNRNRRPCQQTKKRKLPSSAIMKVCAYLMGAAGEALHGFQTQECVSASRRPTRGDQPASSRR